MIVVDDLSYSYPSAKTPALREINLCVKRGELVLITGPSGSGKSTLFFCLKGLVPHLYGGELQGQVVINGQDIANLSVTDIAQRVGLVMQDPESQFCNLFVRDEVAFGVENLKLEPMVCMKRVQDALGALGLRHLHNRSVVELSGGEKQKVAIASVLAMNVPVLLLDEPAANLDARAGREVLHFITQLRDSGKTILLIQHELDEMIHAADRLLILEDGRVLDFGPPRALIEKYGEGLTAKHNIGLPQIAHAALSTRKWFHFKGIPLTIDEFAAQVGKAPQVQPMPISRPRARNNYKAPALVEAEGVSYCYPSAEAQAVKCVSLQVGAGEAIAIAGRNGSGKSTLARLLVGLLKPQEGRVKLSGTDTAKMKRQEIHALTGYVFQYPEHQFLSDTVGKEIAYGLEVQGRSRQEIERITADAIKSLKLTSKEERHPFCLSGGEKRRLSVATMLVLEPRLLILDEPTFGLDEGNLVNLMRFLFEQLQARGITILFITHDMRLVAEHARRVLVLHEGQLVFGGSPIALFHNAALLEHGELLAPPIVELAKVLREQGFPLPENIITLEQFNRAVEAAFVGAKRRV